MDGNGNLHMRNWEYYGPSMDLKGHLGLQLMSPMAEKPFLSGRNNQNVLMGSNGGAFHQCISGVSDSPIHHRVSDSHIHHRVSGISDSPIHHRASGVSDSPISMGYMRDAWVNHRERYFNVLPGNHHHHPGFPVLPETSATQSVQMFQQPEPCKEEPVIQMEATRTVVEGVHDEEGGDAPFKKRSGGKTHKSLKSKKPRKPPSAPRDECTTSGKRPRLPKKNAEVVINGIDMDISGIPIPVCSCTGTPQQCYRWGSGGWQSACCTTSMSMYPLPMSTKRRGARIAGRKMSLGAFKKVLEKLTAEGYNFSHPIDLRTYWAKHGTNKFAIIR